MIKDNLKTVLLTVAIIVSAIIISERISLGAMFIAQTIKESLSSNTVKLSEESIMLLVGELKKRPPRPERTPPPVPGQKVIKGISDGRYIAGKDDAKVNIIEFSDFECPFSKRFKQQAFMKIKENYIDTGKVKYSFRHLPLDFHKNAAQAAAASECAGQQGRFWEMTDVLYAQDKLNPVAIKNSAKQLGLKMKKFDKCFTSEATKKLISEDLDKANKVGINGTPAILINGRLVNGAFPYETFEKIINEELRKQ